jgi:probable HAF family extracellular repeat protein
MTNASFFGGQIKMKLETLSAMLSLTLLVIPARGQVPNQQAKFPNDPPRYRLFDLGTLGGPNSSVGGFQTATLNNAAEVTGKADTSTADPFPSHCFDPSCFEVHAFRWHKGTLSDLGTLPGGSSSVGYQINQTGLVVGWSQDGGVDPISGLPTYHPTVWKNEKIIDLGTFGGSFGIAIAANDFGFVVGSAENGTLDLFGPDALGLGLDGSMEVRAFGYWKGNKFDLGSLGGPDTVPLFVNNLGQVTGISMTSYAPGPQGIPPADPFLWRNGKMIDLGTLGGTFAIPAKVTTHGQVVGDSNLTGDATSHGFSWKDGVLTDVGTFGGSFSTAKWVNESGEVAGFAATENDESVKAFVWKDGKLTDIGTVGSDLCSAAWAINEAGKVVGNSSAFCNFKESVRPFLWEKGQMYDLNSFVPPASILSLLEAEFINDHDDITGLARLPNGAVHQYLLLRCGPQEDHCQGPLENPTRSFRITGTLRQGKMMPGTAVNGPRSRSGNRELRTKP